MSVMKQNGDTLIEVILALVIVVSVLVTALGLSRYAIVNSSNALVRTQAINMVQEQYEVLKDYHRRKSWQEVMALRHVQDETRNDPTIIFNPSPIKDIVAYVGHPDSSGQQDYYETHLFNGVTTPPLVHCEDSQKVRDVYPGPTYAATNAAFGAQDFYMPNAVGVFLANNSTPSQAADKPQARCFHFERDARRTLLPGAGQGGASGGPNPNYGNWVACPGRWFPPLGFDNNWDKGMLGGAIGENGESSDPYFLKFYNNGGSGIGCRGNFRTQPTQPNIFVGISTDAFLPSNDAAGNTHRDASCESVNADVSSSVAFTGTDWMSFAVAAAWNKAGSGGGDVFDLSARGYTRLHSVLGDDVHIHGCGKDYP